MSEARDIYDALKAYGHDHNPDKQIYKSAIAGKIVVLYDPNSRNRDGELAEVPVRAENVEAYVAKGFVFERPESAPEEDAVDELPAGDAGDGSESDSKPESHARRGSTRATTTV